MIFIKQTANEFTIYEHDFSIYFALIPRQQWLDYSVKQ